MNEKNSMHDDSHYSDDDRAIDVELRRVRLPEGLVERIQAGVFGQEQLDGLLTDVALPVGLVERLQAIPGEVEQQSGDDVLASDEAVEIPSRSVAEGVMETALVQVNIPGGMSHRLRSIPSRHARDMRQRARWLQWSLVVFVMLQASMYWVMSGIDGFPLNAVAFRERVEAQVVEVSRYELGTVISETTIQIGSSDLGSDRLTHDGMISQAKLRDPVEVHEAMQSAVNVAAAATDEQNVPQVEQPALVLPRGRPLPTVRGYDRAFGLKYGIRPVMFPGRHWRAGMVQTPISTRRDSYDYLLECLRNGESPTAEQIRVEDFLSAFGQRFPESKDSTLSLHLDGGPSLFGDVESRVIQIGVQAGRIQRSTDPLSVTVVLDASASMQWANKLSNARDALVGMLEFGGSKDRLSVVVARQTPKWLIRDEAMLDTHDLRKSIQSIKAHGGANLASALALGAGLARAQVHQRKSVLIVITDAADVTEREAEEVREEIKKATQGRVEVRILSLQNRGRVWNVQADWANAAGTDLVIADNEAELKWPIVEWLTGQDPSLAKDVFAGIQFDPRSVVAYRQLGHDPDPFRESGGTGGVLKSGESSTLMFQVWLRPKSPGRIGEAFVIWKDSKTGRSHSIKRTISRSEIASTIAQSTKSLQSSQIVAETAERLRHGFNFELAPDGSVRRRRKALQVQPLIQQLEHLLQEESDEAVDEWVKLLKRLQRSKHHRRGGGTSG